ncbi:hypothetical protein PybrP1_000691 [[Pythium] brassicae (nom. inval.)]|nr:hypothetical protein PybrP1_000691 [[Pythium] brassicae (nom. inval.)]
MWNTRMQWVGARLLEAFDPAVTPADVADFLATAVVRRAFDDMLAGRGDACKLFVHLQVGAAGAASDSSTSSDARASAAPLSTTSSNNNSAAGAGKLCLTVGSSLPIRAKCCYFLRTTADGKPVDAAKAGDSALCFGELAPNILRDLETTITALFTPLLRAKDEWGKADADLKGEFMGESDKFATDLKEALSSMDSGLELRRPDRELLADAAGHAGAAGANGSRVLQAADSPRLIAHYEDVLKDWCDVIATYLETNATGDSGGGGRSGGRDEPVDDDGPLGELEHWRRRMQRLTSITEQLKLAEYKDVFTVLSRTSKSVGDDAKQRIQTLLRRWKQIDIGITEAANEAKDNVKYLFTLEKFLVPLYSGSPSSIVDTLPALMNSIKMIHSIARYYNTTERMANLFTKITNQMIANCKRCVTGGDSYEAMWDRDPEELVRHLDACLKLNEAYQQQYRATKDKLFATPKGKQFEFNEMKIFGKFDLFCRRVAKLIDMFTTIHQFASLGQHRLEGMEDLIARFAAIIREFQYRNHDLLDFQNNRFDRDYVEFNVRIADLEGLLQKFINDSFETISSIEHSLALLRKFQALLQRENLKSDLDSKFNVIFQNYGLELEHVLQQYEKHKHGPPYPRNLPPVAGNITWSRHLLKRIEEPMKKFEANQNVLASKDAKRIIRMYNKVARTLVAFEYIWYQAWVQYIDTAKAGLQATLIIRHPEDNKLYVNFDPEILQLLREAKCLDRMGIEIPEAAKIVLLQEDKFKNYFNELQYALAEYDRIVAKVIPVTALLLRPHFNDMEFKLRPGMVTLTWTSMNIEAYRHHVHSGLQHLEELVTNINDIIENRIEKNMRIVSKTLLVDLPVDQSFALDEFVAMQSANIRRAGALLQGKNVEIEHAVEDLLKIIVQYPLDSHIEGVAGDEAAKLKKHYNHFMYQALLHCTKHSLNTIKKRVASRVASNVFTIERPFFEVDVQLSVPRVVLHPSLDDIQLAINKAAKTVTFFDRITKDIEIVRVVLLLTGSVQGLRNNVTEYLGSFGRYEWLWMEPKDAAYDAFLKRGPELQDFEKKLQSFVAIDGEISGLPPVYNIGALSLNTRNIKLQLKHENAQWKLKFSDNLHAQARRKMESLTEFFRATTGKLNRKVVDLDSLRFVMTLLKEVRARESGISMEINPVLDMYEMLEYYLPDGFMEKEEMDQKSVLRSNWRKLVHHAEARTDELSKTQAGFKRGLLRDIKEFVVDVKHFREDYVANGPMVIGIPPAEAVERLNRFKEEFKIRERKFELYASGEELFALPKTAYPELEATKKELQLQDKLFGLYTDVLGTIEEWKQIPWLAVAARVQAMTEKVDAFAARCKKMPAKLREWEAYTDLKQMIDDFTSVLPLLQELSKDSIKPRHWDAVMDKTGTVLDVTAVDFKLQALMDANIVAFKAEIEEITDGADKQLKIEVQLAEIHARWATEEFQFQDWKTRNVPVLKAVVPIVEELEETQMNLQTMLSMRHVAPFRDVAQQTLEQLSDTSETLERWIKVQMLWCSLESVFTGGDIAKQMPAEAKKFQKVDKDWAKIMAKSVETKNVVQCCASELLKSCLPTMYSELEKCQKSLEGYLEQKRNKFPRFYFVSNPGLLMILSQGSDPLSMNEHYEKVFDSIEKVYHDKKDKTLIHTMASGVEEVRFSQVVRAQGNIEDWLATLLRGMQITMKDLCRQSAVDIGVVGNDLKRLREFVDRYIAQFALLGIQLMWTTDIQTALEQCRAKKTVMKDTSAKQALVLTELSNWCLTDLGAKQNRIKIETLVTIHVHQRDVMTDLATLYKQKKLSDANDFEWLKQARFYWRPGNADEFNADGACFPPKGSYPELQAALQVEIDKAGLVDHPGWVGKVIQLYETQLVRHGIMLVGPTGGGKTKIFDVLQQALTTTTAVTHKQSKLNPKAIRAAEMYGEVDPLSGEWTTGVFAAMWSKFNNKANKFITWMVCDGPVDAIWIEDLNTVLDDNKILTLANGDRMPMTDNVKLMFEVETLVNASPATVSRAGIVFVSDTDLDWAPVVEAWVRRRPAAHQPILRDLFLKYMGENSPVNPGQCFDYLNRNTSGVMTVSRIGQASRLFHLLTGLLLGEHGQSLDESDAGRLAVQVEKLFLYCLCWSLGAVLEQDDRFKFDEWLRQYDDNGLLPKCEAGQTVYEHYVHPQSFEWKVWRPPTWEYPKEAKQLDFSNLLVPTMDSVRTLYLIENLHKQRRPVLLVGGPGTAKTSCALMYFNGLNPDQMLIKRVNFSSATTAFMFQTAVESELDKRGGKSFGPPGGKKMTVFLDDLSMPLVNAWGDQPTLEIVRMIIELSGFCFLSKDRRGDFKVCEDLQYVGAMGHPGGGRNDIPNRLKRQFFLFNLILPSLTSIDDIYGQMLAGRFARDVYSREALAVVNKLTRATIDLWNFMKARLLPTPAKFHYIFNMRELSRVFQGVLLTPPETFLSGGGVRVAQGRLAKLETGHVVLLTWKHECDRVFCDKLTNHRDKETYSAYMTELVTSHFGDELERLCRQQYNMVSFLRDPEEDEDGAVADAALKVYEPGGALADIRARVLEFLDRYNAEFPQRSMRLVLFDDALHHLLRISRLLDMPRGSALLVGVGGSGKQSLTRLAAYMSGSAIFQVVLTKTYNTNAFLEDLRTLYKSAGHQRKSTTFLFTDAEIKNEIFLELLNSVLMTGEVAGLFAKDEMMAMTADLRNAFVKERPGQAETAANLKQYFVDCVRDNLHVVLCMSPLNAKFADRARKFPGLISGPTIDWFLPWPEDALIAVSKGFIQDYAMECEPATKAALMTHMGMVHRIVTDLCEEYFQKMRRRVYQTPKSYLSFIESYKKMYAVKIEEIKTKEQRVNLGLRKLIQGAEDVHAMSIVLADEQVKLQKATAETNTMLQSLQVSSAEAHKEGDQVAQIKAKCEEDAARISAEKELCERDLAKAKPFVEEAETAIDSIKPAHIGEIKKLAKPADIIRLVFDGVLILFKNQLCAVKPTKLNVAKQEIDFIETSFAPYAQSVMSDSNFLKNVQNFGAVGKDLINEETIEFLSPYMDLDGFLPAVAKNASLAAEGLCTWVRAMKFYHEASKIVKPKLEALMIAEGQMEAANKALSAAEQRLSKCRERLSELQSMFEAQMAEKKRIEDGANALARKMQQASDLINGLAGERVRWTDDSNNFADLKRRLVGDCAVACAFVSYCGPFNQDFRSYMVQSKFIPDCATRSVPVTVDMDVITFLVDEAERVPSYGTTTLNHPKLKDQLEFCMGEGRALVVTGVEEEIDPMLDPVLERQVIVKGRSLSINVSDKNMEFNPLFAMYFITRLPNPHFGPELQAKTTVIDFTVTIKGLEEQLLGRVIGKEQKALEEQLAQVLEDVNLNTKSLLALDASLLERLTSNTGNLLEDEELIGVLANTKEKAAEVKDKLVAAADTRRSINEKREQFRPVATRGSVLYFSIVETSLINCMYQTSLNQFLALFMQAMDVADKAALASKRVANITETMTYLTYRYINRGLYERDKLTFVLLLTMKILVTDALLTREEVILLTRGGAALDINSVRRKPFSWLANEAWLNVVELAQSCKFFANLPHEMAANEAMWRRWYEDNEPETVVIPDVEARLAENEAVGPYLKLLLVRSLRMDRTILSTKEFIRSTQLMGPRYVDPVTDTIDSIFAEMRAETPVIFLLSIGADPTESIEQLARKRKHPSPAVVSMGEGQEPVALKAIGAAVVNGTWVLLQNCELGLELMEQMEEVLLKLSEAMDPGFRLFLTALPNDAFPLGLLQMSTKVTNEPPQGLRAGLLRSFTVMVDQDKLERVETSQWRQLLFDLCFLHSLVIERKKFGPLGWGIPYEYNNGDLSACTIFLEKHLYNGPISWPTLQYMVAEAQYGGKITDNMDRRLFNFYTEWCLTPEVCAPAFSYNPAEPIFRIPSDFNYRIPVADTIDDYRAFLHTFPEVDSPEVFGLHPNADLTYRVKEVNALLGTLGDTQPKGGGGASGVSREDVVCEKARELLERLPEDYVEDDYKAKISRLGGLTVPLNIFLFQEIQRLQRVIAKVRAMLEQLQMAIRGEVVMTEELSWTLDAIFDAKVPPSWLRTSVGDEFSWILPTLGLWFASLLSRDEQSRSWLNTRRPHCFWLTGFFNPQGMLTAMKQEVTRRHSKTDKWALDDVVYHTEVTPFERAEQVRAPPSEGVYIYGLFMEGATWSKQDGTIVESEPKKLFTSLPVLHVNSLSKDLELRSRKELYGAAGPFECPCYKYASRTDRYFVFMVTMKCPPGRPPRHWGLRGVCLLCNTE